MMRPISGSGVIASPGYMYITNHNPTKKIFKGSTWAVTIWQALCTVHFDKMTKTQSSFTTSKERCCKKLAAVLD